jgi:hypothetical protein
LRAAAPLATCALLAACTPDADVSPGAERTNVDGIEYVVVRGPDVPLHWTFLEDVTIRSEESGEVRFVEPSAWEVGADAEGRIYVLDRLGDRVVVFGRSGRQVGGVGRPGRGPGELAEPVALAVSPDGEVAVYDWAAGGLARWGASGELPAMRLEGGFWGPGLGLPGWGVLYPSLASDGPAGRVVQLVVDGETRTGVLAEIAQATVLAAFPACGLGGLPMEPIFEPQLIWGAGGDIVATATGPGYEFQLFRSGVHETTVSRTIPPRAATRELAMQEVGEGLDLTAPVRCTVPVEELVDARGFAPVVPAIAGLAVAPDRSVWVRRGAVRGESEPPVDIFSSDGVYRGTLPSGSPFPVAFAGDATDFRVVSLRSTETGLTEIPVYRIVR